MVGASQADEATLARAQEVGRGLAVAGAVVLTGGRGGVMAAASRGAAEAGGLTVGILPGADRAEANPHVQVAIATGLGELRNGILVRAVDALIAVGGAYGTLSEIALGLRAGKPVVGLGTWSIEGVVIAATPEAAVAAVLGAVAARA